MISNVELALAFGVAVAGGMINGIAGGGTVLVFPMLVWLGLGPVEANVTNAVSLWTASLGGALGFGDALRQTRRWWFWLSIPAVVGGLAGALLLVELPAGVFESSAPFFVLLATLLMLSQPVLRRKLQQLTDGVGEHDLSTGLKIAAFIAIFVISIYGGYFGAGLGIFLLVALGLLGGGNIMRANGLKNVFSFLIKGVAVLSFAITGNVVWNTALVMMAGSVLGAFAAARLGSRIGARTLRYSIISVGFLMSALMFAGIAG